MKQTPLERIKYQIDKICSVLNRWIWPTTFDIDNKARTFYVFKAFPQHLKSTEIDKWATLQTKTQTPFSQGQHYSYISKAGLHIWYTAEAFDGIPETAAQQPLSNGSHLVKSKAFYYEQQWQQDILLHCVTYAISESNISNDAKEINVAGAWAVEGKLQSALQSPISWIIICLFLLTCGLTWIGTGTLTLIAQQSNLEQQNNLLTSELSEKLTLQTKVRDQQNTINKIDLWQTEFGFLPESTAIVMEKLNAQDEWKTNLIIWQNKTIELEFVSKSIDITRLIAELEQHKDLEEVNIRPHNAENTWVLEAKAK